MAFSIRCNLGAFALLASKILCAPALLRPPFSKPHQEPGQEL
jgi:hypothetical protein